MPNDSSAVNSLSQERQNQMTIIVLTLTCVTVPDYWVVSWIWADLWIVANLTTLEHEEWAEALIAAIKARPFDEDVVWWIGVVHFPVDVRNERMQHM